MNWILLFRQDCWKKLYCSRNWYRLRAGKEIVGTFNANFATLNSIHPTSSSSSSHRFTLSHSLLLVSLSICVSHSSMATCHETCHACLSCRVVTLLFVSTTQRHSNCFAASAFVLSLIASKLVNESETATSLSHKRGRESEIDMYFGIRETTIEWLQIHGWYTRFIDLFRSV